MTASERAMTAAAPEDAVVWHDVECADYGADREVWRQLAASAAGAVLELGAGTGRVALDLAGRGHEVAALDSDPTLTRELARRARQAGVSVRATSADARSFELGRRFALAIAPMQVVQLLGGARGRAAMLDAVRSHLEPGGALAVALADPIEGVPEGDLLPPLPDVREIDGWVYSSRPIAVRDVGDSIAIDRFREAVGPDGRLSESLATIVLDRVRADEFAAEAAGAGWCEHRRLRVPETPGYVGSDVLVLERTP